MNDMLECADGCFAKLLAWSAHQTAFMRSGVAGQDSRSCAHINLPNGCWIVAARGYKGEPEVWYEWDTPTGPQGSVLGFNQQNGDTTQEILSRFGTTIEDIIGMVVGAVPSEYYNNLPEDTMIYFSYCSCGDPHSMSPSFEVVLPDESWGDVVRGDGRSYNGSYHDPMTVAELRKINTDINVALRSIVDKELG